MRLLQQRIHERGLTVIDVRDDRHVSEIVAMRRFAGDGQATPSPRRLTGSLRKSSTSLLKRLGSSI